MALFKPVDQILPVKSQGWPHEEIATVPSIEDFKNGKVVANPIVDEVVDGLLSGNKPAFLLMDQPERGKSVTALGIGWEISKKGWRVLYFSFKEYEATVDALRDTVLHQLNYAPSPVLLIMDDCHLDDKCCAAELYFSLKPSDFNKLRFLFVRRVTGAEEEDYLWRYLKRSKLVTLVKPSKSFMANIVRQFCESDPDNASSPSDEAIEDFLAELDSTNMTLLRRSLITLRRTNRTLQQFSQRDILPFTYRFFPQKPEQQATLLLVAALCQFESIKVHAGFLETVNPSYLEAAKKLAEEGRISSCVLENPPGEYFYIEQPSDATLLLQAYEHLVKGRGFASGFTKQTLKDYIESPVPNHLAVVRKLPKLYVSNLVGLMDERELAELAKTFSPDTALSTFVGFANKLKYDQKWNFWQQFEPERLATVSHKTSAIYLREIIDRVRNVNFKNRLLRRISNEQLKQMVGRSTLQSLLLLVRDLNYSTSAQMRAWAANLARAFVSMPEMERLFAEAESDTNAKFLYTLIRAEPESLTPLIENGIVYPTLAGMNIGDLRWLLWQLIVEKEHGVARRLVCVLPKEVWGSRLSTEHDFENMFLVLWNVYQIDQTKAQAIVQTTGFEKVVELASRQSMVSQNFAIYLAFLGLLHLCKLGEELVLKELPMISPSDTVNKLLDIKDPCIRVLAFQAVKLKLSNSGIECVRNNALSGLQFSDLLPAETRHMLQEIVKDC